jgi:FHA domain
MTATCPKGHSSSEEDFCSECGAKIAGAPVEAAPPGAEICPDCRTPRARDSSKFCELCGYNYETGAHGEIPLPPSQPPAAVTQKWTVHIAVDPALKENGSPEPPESWAPLEIAADHDTLLIGRTSQSRNVFPEIPLDFDTAVSHRHAVLSHANGSGWLLRDIGSSNGTRINGQDVTAMVDVPLNQGDRITLGHWTCLTLSCDSEV